MTRLSPHPSHTPATGLDAPRLWLIPLTLKQMRWQRENYARLEKSLHLPVSGQRLEEEMRPIVARACGYMQREPEQAIWHTQWLAVLKTEQRIVGGLGFKGPADDAGRVEIGYGFAPDYHNRGLATEAVRALTGWALAQPGIAGVMAETANTNVPSMRVLQKAGFVITSATDRYLYWILQ